MTGKQKELLKIENDLFNLKEKIINHFKDFKEVNSNIVNSFIDVLKSEKKTNPKILKILLFIGIFSISLKVYELFT